MVADTGDFKSLQAFAPRDSTTNPTLIYKAVQQPDYAPLLDRAREEAMASGLQGDALVEEIIDRLLIVFGVEITGIIPGRVSTEVDARLSFDTEATLEKARKLIRLYHAKGIGRERILIKIASTWEGLQAAKILEEEGIHCNLTLLFSLAQAIVAAENGITLISPFVGRIYDWYKKDTGKDYSGPEDPGVQSVQKIYHYYKHFGYGTEVMGASFRIVGQIIELAGCDLLTISPNLLEELKSSTEPLVRKLDPEMAKSEPIDRIPMDEKTFRWMLNADAMATEKLADGIRRFDSDTNELRALIRNSL